MKTRPVDFLLIGGGLASATAAETIRSEGADGSILILSDEDVAPYNRPPLSKQVLLGKIERKRLFLLDETEIKEKRIGLLLACRALAVNPRDKIVRTSIAGDIGFRQLLIATGVAPRSLSVPGADLVGVFCLRTLADADTLHGAIGRTKRAVVVGASFLGLEVAATLTRLGVTVTVLDQEPAVLSTLQAPAVSSKILELYRRQGVKILLGTTVAAFHGKGRVSEVVTDSGKALPCDLVVVAVGVEPNIAFLEGSGIAVDNGVLVDQFLRTSQPDIFAAGDVANTADRVTGTHRRVEHWDNAVKQGRVAAKNMLGARLPYDEVSYFYSDAFDFSFEFMGVPEGADRVVERGSLAENSYARIFLKHDIAQALFTTGRPPMETTAVEALIRYHVNLHSKAEQLSDPGFALEQIPNQTVLILQGGGAMGAFEAGVVRALEEARIFPDIVAGVSIGAFNGAIIASNPTHATAALDAFWDELAVNSPAWFGGDANTISSWYTLALGTPNLFRPRWFNRPGFDELPMFWTSFYDTSPAKALIARYVDFAALKRSPVRLLISAVDVETGELRVFDSYADDLTPGHILASSSLPPGFPWTTIAGQHYWDGGIISNSPLEQLTDRCGVAGKRVFIVDLFSNARALPSNMMEVFVRRDEIVYAERINKDIRRRELARDVRDLVDEMLGYMEPEAIALLKQRPRYIQVMGELAPTAITRIVRKVEKAESPARDYDFSKTAVEENRQHGYTQAKRALTENDVEVRDTI